MRSKTLAMLITTDVRRLAPSHHASYSSCCRLRRCTLRQVHACVYAALCAQPVVPSCACQVVVEAGVLVSSGFILGHVVEVEGGGDGCCPVQRRKQGCCCDAERAWRSS